MNDQTTDTAPLSMTDDELANLSDDELMQLEEGAFGGSVPEEEDLGPAPAEEAAGEEVPAEAAEPGASPAAAEADGEEAEGEKVAEPATPAEPAAPAEPTDPEGTEPAKEGEPTDPAPAEAAEKGEGGEGGEEDGKPAEPAEPAAAPVDYEAAYKQIFAPFKANGKQVQIQSPDEAVRLMQMGANYTKKMQALQPHLKMVRMLEDNGLLDNDKLGFLIDLERKDPAAIAKYLKDANVDPMDIDTDNASSYQPKDYRVSDEEMRFTSVLDEVGSTQEGSQLIQEIDKGWDKPSQNAIYQDPSILSVLNEHKASGIYDAVTSEMERQEMLGQLGGRPRIQAYYEVAQQLQKAGKLTPSTPEQQSPAPADPAPAATPAPQPAPEAQPRVLAQQAPRKAAPADDKVRAAMASQPTAPAPKKADFNPLAMSDEEFEKQAAMAERL